MALAAEELRADGERSSLFSGSALGSLLHDGLILKFWRLAHAAWPEGASCPNPAAAMNPRAAHSAHQSPSQKHAAPSTAPPYWVLTAPPGIAGGRRRWAAAG